MRNGQRLVLLGALVLGVNWALAQQPPDSTGKPVTPDKAPGQTTDGKSVAQPESRTTSPTRTGEKTIAFEMRDKPWVSVLEWLSDQAGIPVMTVDRPTGTFTFIAPKNAPREYTIPQIIDILNEALVNQKFIIIRRSNSFTIVAADNPIDRAILPRLTPEELDQHGATELANVPITLKTLVAEDVAPEVKKMMGPFGEVVSLSGANQLLMTDTVGNLKRILKTIKQIEENEQGQENLSYPCTYVKARDAERMLKELLGNPAADLLRQAQQQQQFGGRGDGGQGGPGGGFDPRGGGFDPRRGGANLVIPKIRMHYISSDERTNSVHVTGPANKIAQARDLLKKFDAPQPGQKPITIGTPDLKTYQVPAGNAVAVAQSLSEIYRAVPSIKIFAGNSTTIMVWANPEDQFEIARQILGTNERNTSTELIPLMTLDATSVASTLNRMFGQTTTITGGTTTTAATGPFIEADTGRNALVVRGSVEQVNEVRTVLKSIGESGLTGNLRVINLDKGNAATLADELQRLMKQLRPNPVEVIVPGKKGATPDGQEEQEPQDPRPAPKQQLVDPREQPKVDQQSPVKITVFGNKLYLSSEDPAALQLAQELVRQLTQNQPVDQGLFEVIKLKNANATDAARILEEAFNGRQQGGGGQQGGMGFPGALFGGGRFGGGDLSGGRPTTPVREPQIRVVADPATNSLLVRASPLIMLEVKRLIKESLDADDEDARSFTRTYIIGPLKFARAVDIATILRDVYREQTSSTPSATTVGGLPGFGGAFGGMGMMRGGMTGGPGGGRGTGRGNSGSSAGNLNVGVDDQSNSLVVACSERMHEDVKKLVEQLETAAKDSNSTVKVVSIKGIDPNLVQEAIDAIQGRRPTTSGGGSGGGQFGNRGSGFGGSNNGGQFGNRGGNFGSGGFGGNRTGFGGGGGPGGGQGGFGMPGGGQGGFGNFNQGGGGRGGGPGGRSASLNPGGSDFFARGVKDDPQSAILFDPRSNATDLVAVHHEEEQQQPPAGAQPMPQGPAGAQPAGQAQVPPGIGESIRAPRGNVTAEALEQLGIMVIRGQTQADVDEVLRMIETIQKIAKGTELNIRIVRLKQADPVSLAATLTQLYTYVNIGAGGTYQNIIRPTVGFGGQQQIPQTGSVFMLPLARFNALMVVAPQIRLPDIEKQIEQLDQPTAPSARATPFALKRAAAGRIATLVQNFYAQRYPNETNTQNLIRITSDDVTNTVFVQAAPADMEEIRSLIERLDVSTSSAVSELRIVPLRSATADVLATVLSEAFVQGFSTAGSTSTGTQLQRAVSQVNPLLGQPGLGTGTQTIAGSTTKINSLRFVTTRGNGPRAIEAGMLDDIKITPDARINALIITAPAQTMELVLALINALDVPPVAQAEVKVFQLKRADATTMAQMVQQLFLGSTQLPGSTTGAAAGGTTVTIPRSLFTLGGDSPQGAQVIDLRLTIDPRTNSLIVGGSRNDVEVIEALVSRLEDADVQQRKHEVYQCKNASSIDIANALRDFYARSLTIIQNGGQLNAFQEFERDVVIVPEPISNKLLISATPNYFGDLLRLIVELDMLPPQVVIQVLVAEVDLSATEDLGLEVGLQSPILFTRSIYPLGLTGSTGNVTAANTGTASIPGSPVSQGVTVNSTVNPLANPGYRFNTTDPLGNNPLANPKIVGFQGLSKLGVGRGNGDVGGFVFSAASDSFTMLLRALKTQGRVDIMARPQVMTLNNQTALVTVGVDYPLLADAIATVGVTQQSIVRRNVGVILQVTPTINPDGTVLMRVIPEISSIDPIPVDLGNGLLSTAINIQHVETSIAAQDGETVAIGGLISKRDTKNENKIPWLGDLPIVGAAFRFRTQSKEKKELLVILTPHVVRNAADRERILAMEAKRMDWIVNDVTKLHGGPAGIPAIAPPPPPPGVDPLALPQLGTHGPVVPAPGTVTTEVLPQPQVVPPGGTPAQLLPAPQPLPNQATPPATQPGQPPTAQPPKQAAAPAPEPSMIKAAGFWGPEGNSPKEILSGRLENPPKPPEPPKEKKGWNWFSREKSK